MATVLDQLRQLNLQKVLSAAAQRFSTPQSLQSVRSAVINPIGSAINAGARSLGNVQYTQPVGGRQTTVGQTMQQFAQNVPQQFSSDVQSSFRSIPGVGKYLAPTVGLTVGSLGSNLLKGGTTAFSGKHWAEQAGDILGAAGTVISPGQTLGGGVVGSFIKGAQNLVSGSPLGEGQNEAFTQGVESGGKFAGLSQLTAPLLNPVSKFVNPAARTSLNYYINLAQNTTNQALRSKVFQLAAKRFGQQVLDAAIQGGVGFGALGAVAPAANIQERLTNIKDQALQGAAFAGVLKTGTIGTDVASAQIPKIIQNSLENARRAQMKANFAKDLTSSKVGVKNLTQAVDNEMNAEPLLAQAPSVQGPASVAQQFESLPGKKMRGFSERVATGANTPEPVKAAVKGAPESYYQPLSNKQTMKAAQDLIAQNEDDALAFARTGTDTNANATAVSLIEKYLKDGQYEKANALIKDVSPRFTSQGQQIQILSQYSKLTPTGAVKFAQRLIDEANGQLPPGNKLSLTNDATKDIVKLAESIQKLPEGRERLVATAQLMDTIGAQVPATLGQKISTLQTMAQLLNPKTAIRNTVGNTGFAAAENVSDVVGTGIDKLLSTVTGQRTKVLPSISAQLRGVKEGFRLGFDDAIKGIDTSGGVSSQFDLPRRTFRSGILGNLEKAMNVELRATDRAAYTGAMQGSLNNQMRAAGVTTPTPQMIEIAHADGLYRTFQDKSMLAQVFSGIKKTLNKVGTPGGEFGLGDLILKYPKTPANILQRGIDYSPAGFVNSVYQLVKPSLGKAFNQKQFVESTSRALVGTGAVTTGYLLAKLGIVTGKSEKDRDIAAVQRSQGLGAYKINFSALKRFFLSGMNPEAAKPREGDTLATYDWFQPQSINFSLGVNSALGGKAADLASNFDAGVESLTSQPLIKGVSDFVTTLSDPNRGGFSRAVQNAVLGSASGFTPSIVNQVGQMFDNTSRDTYDPNALVEAANKVKARLPGLRNTLNPRIDVFGNEQEQYQNGSNNLFNVFFNPAFISKFKADPVASEVLDLFERSGETQQAPRVVDKKLTINGQKIPLSGDQLTQYQRYVGQRAESIFSQTINTPEYQTLSDDQKAKVLGNLLTDINSAAKIELFGDKPKTVRNSVKTLLGEPVAEKKVSVKKPKSTSTKVKVKSGAKKRLSLKPKKLSLAKIPTTKATKKITFKQPKTINASALRLKTLKPKSNNRFSYIT